MLTTDDITADMSEEQFLEYIQEYFTPTPPVTPPPATPRATREEELAAIDASLYDINASLAIQRNLLSDFNRSSSAETILRSNAITEENLNRRFPPAELRPRRPTTTVSPNSVTIEVVSRGKTEQMHIRNATFDIYFANKLKKELDEPCANACNICYETPTIGASLITSCGHEFCKECYIKWVDNSNREPSCPSCRKKCPCVVMFKHRQQKIVMNNIKAISVSKKQVVSRTMFEDTSNPYDFMERLEEIN
jgi:hypothetical protein